MFNWMVKVVPQAQSEADQAGEHEQNVAAGKPPGTRGKLKSVKSIREDDQASETSQNSIQSGVLNWLSNGFVSTLPQPTGSPHLQRANSETKISQEDSSDRSGVIGWISQGLGKVVPQPEVKYTQNNEESDEETEVYDTEELPDAEPLPNVPVVEMVSEVEVPEAEASSTQFPPGVVQWLKTGFQNALPYHMPRPPDHPENGSQRSSRSSDKVFSPPPESVTSLTEVDAKISVVGWIVHGLGLAMPQPVIKSKQDYGEVTEAVVQNEERLLRAS